MDRGGDSRGVTKKPFFEFVTLQRGFDLPKTEMRDGPYPVIGSTSIIGYHDEFKVDPPGVVTGRSGSLGTVQFINDRYWPHNTSLWVKDFKGNDPRFVFYRLQGLDFARFNAGAGVPTLNRNHLDTLEVDVPSIPMQRRIAGILSAYDGLIENNQRRIRILEQMARSLYLEWFVHFRFPGHEKSKMVPSPLGPIPQGWEVKLVKDILTRRGAGTVYRESSVKQEGTVPVLDQSTSEFFGFHDNEADHFASPESPLAIFGDHTCKMQLFIEPFSVGPNVVPFAANAEMPTAYVFFAANSLVQTQEYKRHWKPLNAKEVIVAAPATARHFASMIQPMLVEQESLRKVIYNLRRARNLLLPRLLSGKLKLDIETGKGL